MAVLLTPPFMQFFDENGDPLAGGKIYSYSAGTTTKKATYTDETATHQNTNPIILDDAGRAVVFIQGSYRFDTYDANDVLIRSVDNVTSFATLESSNNAYFESFSGTGSKTSFTTSETLGTESAAIQVYVNTPVQSYVDNGDFASDTIWTKGSGWSIGAGVATATGAISTAISQTSPKTVTSGRAYRVTYTITRSAGGLIPSIGGANGTERTASGTYTEIVIAGSTQTIAFTGNGFTGTLDTVTIENIDTTGFQIQDPSTYTINGTALEFAVAPPYGTNNIYVFAPTQLVGAAVAAADQAIAAQVAAEAAVITVQNQKIVWMGDWAAGTYNINEAVFYNGSSWIVTAATTIDMPSIASPDWDLLCEKGTDGTGGIPSPTASQVYSFLRASGTGTYTWFSGTTTVSAASTISLVGGNTTLVTIAGSGTINSFGTPVYSGDIRFIRFGTSTVTLAHSASSGGIELPGAANISTATGDYAIFVSSSTGTWRCWSYSKASGVPLAFENSSIPLSKLSGVYDAVVDRAYAEYTANSDITTVIPADDTVPLVSEGTQVLSVSITPKSTTNVIRLKFDAEGATNAGSSIIAAIFDGSTCLAAKLINTNSTNATGIQCVVEVVPGVTTAKTYTVRVGPGGAGTLRLNGTATARYLGGSMRATLIAEELRA